MTAQTFSYQEALKFGWTKLKDNFWFFAGLILIIIGLSYMSDVVNEQMKANPTTGLSLLGIAIWIVMMITDIGIIRISLRIYDGKEVDYGDLFKEYNKVFNYFLASVLYIFMVVAGLILLLIPGIYLAIRFQFFPYFIVDQNLGPIESLKKSRATTKGNVLELFVLGLILIGIIILGILALLVGIFVAFPIAILAVAFVYRKLNPQSIQKDLDPRTNSKPDKDHENKSENARD